MQQSSGYHKKKSRLNSLEFTLLDSDENKSNFTYLHKH